jgi:glycosyltransferase involved in cell wall biosynthesis
MRTVQETGQKLATKRLRKADPLPNFGNSTAASEFAMRRRSMSEFLNANCDHVLCVSEAAKKTAVRYGVSQKLAVVSYIGTPAARLYQESNSPQHALDDDGALKIAFLGYMRRDKGFHFLLEALERLPSLYAGRIKLVVAAKRGDAKLAARLKRLELTLAEVKVWDGYRAEQLDRILDGVALGVVPVLWQDNLPQVAIEMHSRRIPLLTSDLGGAKELSNSSDLVFRAGDHAEFAARLESIITGKITFEGYWSGARIPPDLDAHLKELIQFYAKDTARGDYASRVETNSQSFQFTEMSGS